MKDSVHERMGVVWLRWRSAGCSIKRGSKSKTQPLYKQRKKGPRTAWPRPVAADSPGRADVVCRVIRSEYLSSPSSTTTNTSLTSRSLTAVHKHTNTHTDNFRGIYMAFIAAYFKDICLLATSLCRFSERLRTAGHDRTGPGKQGSTSKAILSRRTGT